MWRGVLQMFKMNKELSKHFGELVTAGSGAKRKPTNEDDDDDDNNDDDEEEEEEEPARKRKAGPDAV